MSEIESFIRLLRLRLSPSTCDNYRWILCNYLEYLSQHTSDYLRATKEDIQGYLVSLKSCNQQSRHKRLQVIREFYTYLQRPENPAKEISVPAPHTKRLHKIPNKVKVASWLNKLTGKTPFLEYRHKVMFELAYGSGLRRCELHRLNIEDIDWDNKTAVVTGKGSISRLVPLTKQVMKLLPLYLSERKAYQGPLFATKEGKRLSLVSIGVIFRSKTGRSPHVFRHACASHMLQNGCDIRYIQELLGHKSLTTTQTYTYFDKNHLRDVIIRVHPRALVENGKK